MEFNLDTRQIVADDYTKQAYIEFGAYSNLNRHLPYLLDGLKPVYRKTIIAAYNIKEKGFVKTARIVGETIGKYSCHGDKSVIPVVSELVNLGIFEGQGNHGGTNIDGSQLPPAAPRYTEARLSNAFRESMDAFIDVLPHCINELGNDEPEYIPTTIPFCLAEYTKVKLADGRSITMKDLANECLEGKENFLFSCSEDGEFRISKLNKCWKTKSVNKLIRITLDNDEVIDSTEDHKFMLRNGSYLPASELKVGISLMPGYFGESESYRSLGRTTILNNYTGDYSLVMDLADNYNKSHGIYSDLDKLKTLRHHVDKNSNNNNPTNIIRVNHKEHVALHRDDISKGLIKYNKEHKDEVMARVARARENGSYENCRIRCKEWNKNPEIIRKQVETKRLNGAYKIFGAKLAESNRNSESIRKRVETMHKNNLYNKFANNDPEFIIKQHKGKFRKLYYKLLELKSPEAAINEISNKWNFSKYFNSVDEFKSYINFNHKIKSIEIINLDDPIDVYDLEVNDRYHNFLLDAGIVVHNCLVKGDLGIGIGTGCRIPALNPASLIKAYRADDPTLLESAYGLQLVKERSSLKSLWEFGTGRITRKFKTQWIDGGISIEGDATIAVPDLGYMYQQQDWQNVEIIDASKEVGKLLIRKLPRVKNITEDEIRKFVEMASYVRESYYVRTFYGKTAAPIGIRDWIDICYKNYCRLINTYKDKNIKKYERSILIYKNFSQVADKILKTEDSYDKIASDLGIEKFIVDEVGKKPINTLRNLDPNKEIKKAEEKINEFKSINPDAMVDKQVNTLK